MRLRFAIASRPARRGYAPRNAVRNILSSSHCPGPGAGDRGTVGSQRLEWRAGEAPLRIALPVPLPDGSGGLLRELHASVRMSFEEQREGNVVRYRLALGSGVVAALKGERMVSLPEPEGWNW